MTKKERRNIQLERHYKALEALAALHGVTINGKRTSSKLLRIEYAANKAAADYCNGDIDTEKWETVSDETKNAVKSILGFLPDGFLVNPDARGYALKIDDEKMRESFRDCGLMTDRGGYGLLAPTIDGN